MGNERNAFSYAKGYHSQTWYLDDEWNDEVDWVLIREHFCIIVFHHRCMVDPFNSGNPICCSNDIPPGGRSADYHGTAINDEKFGVDNKQMLCTYNFYNGERDAICSMAWFWIGPGNPWS